MKIYDLDVIDKNGKVISMSKYKGNVLLIVNTATGCGFTPQYEWLKKLYTKYKDKGFIILDFPCDQFGHQAPGSDEDINSFCTSRYNTTFPRFKKGDVNGDNATDIFKFLKEKQTFKSKKLKMKMLSLMSSSAKNKDDIRWNFTKFLVDREGNVIDRFEPTDEENIVTKKIEEVINE